MDFSRELPAYTQLNEPELVFANDQCDKNPLRGLINFGPYSLNMKFFSEIKIAFITTENGRPKLNNLFKQLRSQQKTVYAKDYFPDYKGFEEIYKVPLKAATKDCHRIFDTETEELAKQGQYKNLAKKIKGLIVELAENKHNFSVIFIYIPDSWSQCFKSDGFDLHDYLKAHVAPLGIAFQIINDKTFSNDCRSSVMWNLSLAIYAKSSGIPWKLKTLSKDEVFMGLSYSMKTNESHTEFCTCCSQIYEPDGMGFEFIAYDTKPQTVDYRNNPYLSEEDMQAVIIKSLNEYRKSHHKSPKKITIHKNTKFTDDEIRGALNSFNSDTQVELVQIVSKTDLYGIKWTKKTPDDYGVSRGVYQPLSENEALFWIKGPVLGANLAGPNKQTYKDFIFEPTPRPVLLRRFSGTDGWHGTCQSIMGLTKMDWNQSTLHKKLPVTLLYSSLFARVLKQNENMTDKIYNFRCFM